MSSPCGSLDRPALACFDFGMPGPSSVTPKRMVSKRPFVIPLFGETSSTHAVTDFPAEVNCVKALSDEQ